MNQIKRGLNPAYGIAVFVIIEIIFLFVFALQVGTVAHKTFVGFFQQLVLFGCQMFVGTVLVDGKPLKEYRGICRLIENPREAERMGENARKIGAAANGQAVFEQWRDYIRTLTGDTEQKGTEK